MNKTTHTILLIINSIAFIGAIIWAFIDFGPEPLITSLALLAGIIGLWVNNPDADKRPFKQKIVSGKKSKNYQAGRDIKINQDE